MTRPLKRTLYGLLAVALLVTALPVAALAQTDMERPPRDNVELTEAERVDRLDAIKARVIAQIERRLVALDRLTGRVEKADHITESHAATLLADIGAADEVLRAGLDTVAAVGTFAELREVAPAIFRATLVFALLGPKTHGVIGSDTVTAIAERYNEFEARLQDSLDDLAAGGVDTSDAQADLDEIARLVTDAAATGGPVAETIIGLQPGDWPDPAQAALTDARSALESTRSQLREARDLGRTVIEFIRSHADGGEDV